MTPHPNAGAVVFAKDPRRLAAFYESVAALKLVEAHDDHLILESAQVQLVLHGLPAAIASGIEIATPPKRREDTAIKLFFWVAALAEARTRAAALGGALGPQSTEWAGRGFLACDGYDPEGNVVQFRQITAQ